MENKQERDALATLLARAQNAHQHLTRSLKAREDFFRETGWNKPSFPGAGAQPEYWRHVEEHGKKLDGIDSEVSASERCVLRLLPDLHDALLLACARSAEGKATLEVLTRLPLVTRTAETLLHKPDLAVRNLRLLISLFDSVGRHARKSGANVGRRGSPALTRLKAKVRSLKDAKKTFPEICKELGDQPRPEGVSWKELSWPKAYRDPSYRNAVKKWLSTACR